MVVEARVRRDGSPTSQLAANTPEAVMVEAVVVMVEAVLRRRRGLWWRRG